MAVIKKLAILIVLINMLMSCGSNKTVDKVCKEIDVDTLISIVKNQQVVLDKIKLIDSLSNHTRKIIFKTQPQDSLESIYLVKVGEDNGVTFVTYFDFLVEINTLKIVNPKGKLPEQ